MKKTLMVAALTGVFATAAHAQSSVTLYGLIDEGLTYTNNQGGHSNWQETSGSINGSRWGLRGSEDLGGGLKAIFTLENGFTINNGQLGQSSRIFGRQAFVGLSSNQFGAVTLGRQYDSVVDYVAPLSMAWDTQFAHPFDNDNLNNSFRLDNTIKYTSVNYAGFQFGGLYGFSNNADGFDTDRSYSFGASYTYGGLKAAAGYLQLNNNPDSTLNFGASSSGSIAGDGSFVAARQRTFGGGLNYTFGPATVGFVYTQTNLSGVGGAGTDPIHGLAVAGLAEGDSARFQNFEGNIRYALTPALSLNGSYVYTRGNLGEISPNWNQVNLQADYFLSRRTDVYVQGEYQHISSNSAGLAPWINGLSTPSNGGADPAQSQVAVTIGMRHRF
ncbi:porin [Burkholderia sp. WAC0059]|uniref:porin n=1 Tax=Burkholderia sp. WAC0059 TaxID=2066022 RepID=UPI000C7F0950|nr:porin [Burkholderia sp. WAC0059]PLZ00388.1 porin [Burkholderia sp. WAC0059]